jgi:hypothetical protein
VPFLQTCDTYVKKTVKIKIRGQLLNVQILGAGAGNFHESTHWIRHGDERIGLDCRPLIQEFSYLSCVVV